MVDNQYGILVDGKLAEESGDDSHWMKFEKGHYEIMVDLGKQTKIENIMLRTLNYAKENVNAPLKVYVYASDNGESFNLLAIKDAPFFPNNKHDAWIDGILFDDLQKKTRYLKVAFEALEHVYMDEIFINPTINETAINKSLY